MKTVLLLGGPAAGQRVEVHGCMRSVFGQVNPTHAVLYNVVPMCSHGEVHWFGVLDGADPLALLIAGYSSVNALHALVNARIAEGIDAVVTANSLTGGTPAPADYDDRECGRPGKFA